MTTEEMLARFRNIALECLNRMQGPGAAQYARAEAQRFEKVALGALCNDAIEELLDTMCYSAMLIMRLEDLKKRLE